MVAIKMWSYFTVLLVIVIEINGQNEMISQFNNGTLLYGDSKACPADTTMCIYRKKATEDLANMAILATCLGANGTILAESKSVEANPSKNKTDITSVTFIGLNTTPQQHQLLMDSLIAGYKAIQKGQIPSIQFPASSTYPQYSQQQLPIGQYGQSPVIIMQAPSSPFCVNPATGAWYNQVGMPPANIYGVPPYGLPPMQPPPGQPTMGKYQGQMPTSLATVWEIIAKLKEDTAQLERAVSDASSSARPNSYDPNNANVFNVPIPYSASIY